jgi:exodeoxyribonuclease-3
MRIITWNVNGLRSVLGKGKLDWVLEQDAEFICLQEIKTRPDQLEKDMVEKFTSWQVYWNSATRPGYSGVATLCKRRPQTIEYGLGVQDFDREGRVVMIDASTSAMGGMNEPGLLLFNIYFPNGQRDQGRLAYKLDFYARVLTICDSWHRQGLKIILCGDFNTAHNPIDLKNPKQNEKNSGFMPEERAWLDRYQEHGFVDAYRILYPERVQYTWWTYIGGARERNVGWRLDFFMVSEALMPGVKDVIIHDEVQGSDHCPVSLILG